MSVWRKLRHRFLALFQKRKLEAEMDEEMCSHIEMRTRENIDAGMNPEEARYAALRQFGWVESIKDTCRDQRGLSGIENLGRDVRFGARTLRKNPGFTALAVLTLALGIAGNVVIFSIFNGLFLRPLPFQEPERLVDLNEVAPKWNLCPRIPRHSRSSWSLLLVGRLRDLYINFLQKITKRTKILFLFCEILKSSFSSFAPVRIGAEV